MLEAQEILKSKYRKESPVGDLDTEGEKLLGKYVKETYNSEFVFITHYPKEARPMYTMQNKENPAITDSFDLLYKGLEITSGHSEFIIMNCYSLRLKKRITSREISILFKYIPIWLSTTWRFRNWVRKDCI